MHQQLKNEPGTEQSIVQQPVPEVMDQAAELITEPLPSEEVDRLLNEYRSEAEKLKRKHEKITLVVVLTVLLLVIMLLATGRVASDAFSNYGTYLICLMGFLGAVGATVGQKKAVAKLALSDDLRVVGPLVDSFGFGDAGTRQIAVERLSILLPRLKASDADLLTAQQKQLLAKQLIDKNEAFKLAILKAFEQIGDGSILPIVKFVAEGSRKRNPKLHQAANECIQFVTQRVAEQKERESLLRASTASDYSAGGELLRPVTETASTNPEELLRPDERPIHEQGKVI